MLSTVAAMMGHGPEPGYRRGALQGGKILWAAPIIRQTNEVWREIKAIAAPVTVGISERDRDLFLVGGGQIMVRSADQPDTSRGVGLDGAILDEAAFMRAEFWRNVVRPALSDRRGWAILGTTPNGRNWLYDEVISAPKQRSCEAWQSPTSDNGLISADELEDARLTLPRVVFDQEYMAKFVQKIGAEWGPECFEGLYDSPWPDAFEFSAIAIDPSQGSAEGDYCAIVFVGYSGGKLFVDAVIDRLSAAAIALATLELYIRYCPQVVGIEANANQSLAFGPLIQQAAEDIGLPPIPLESYTHRGKLDNKQLRIYRIGPYMKDRRFRFRRSTGCTLLEEQLRDFPLRDAHDDGPDALECAVRMLNLRAHALTTDTPQLSLKT